MSIHNLYFEQKYGKYLNFLSENFPLLAVKFSIYLNRLVFVMKAERDSYKEKLAKSQTLSRELFLQLENPEILTRLTLDASVIIDTTKLAFETLGSLELNTRECIYRIHMRRLVALRRISLD